MSAPEPPHIPVLVNAVLDAMAPAAGGVLVDCTVGLGGHAFALLERMPRLRLIGLDVDPSNLDVARARLAGFGDRVRLIQANFADLADVVRRADEDPVAGLLADLGVSSNQLARASAGLSFEVDGPLDMRLDPTLSTTAADFVNGLPERELADLLYLQCQERRSRRIAKRICEARRHGRLNSTAELARLVASAVGADRPRRIHPATRTFLALRIAVNREMEALDHLLTQAPNCLHPGGRLAVISFHSGEDRRVKADFRRRAAEGAYRLVTRRAVVPDDDERRANPRCRSAKMRVVERRAGT